MLRSPFRTLRLLLLAPLLASAALAQGPASQSLRLATPSFVFARYATVSAAALYAARGFGPVGGFVGIVQNPRTEYRELIAGAFTQANWSRHSVLVAVGYADATESEYVQTYITPSLGFGAISLSGTIEWYEPLESSGTRQLDINPLLLVARVHSRVGLGAAYTQGMAQGDGARHRAGPVVEFSALWGSVRLEVLRRFTDETTEVRTAVFAGF